MFRGGDEMMPRETGDKLRLPMPTLVRGDCGGILAPTQQVADGCEQELSKGISLSRTPVDPQWDTFVDHAPGGHHLQTSRWAQVKASYGWHAVRVKLNESGELLGGFQLLLREVPLGRIAYCPRGPVLRDRSAASGCALLEALEMLARTERLFYVKVQPPAGGEDFESLLRARGFVASDLFAAPVATVRVDLERSCDEILASMRHGTRSNIRQAARKGIVVRKAGLAGLTAFGELITRTSDRQKFPPYPIEYYGKILKQFGEHQRAELFLAEREHQVLSGAIVVGHGDSVVYKMGAWVGHNPGLHPNEAVLWHAMLWARERGYRYYDFDGISEAAARAILAGNTTPDSGRQGPTYFKLGFGGEVTLYPPAYDRSFHPLMVWPVRLLAPHLKRLDSTAHRLVGRVQRRA